MNREIKFRGKSVKSGEWVYGCYCRIGGGIVCILPFDTGIVIDSRGQYVKRMDFIEVLPETVSQQVGLKDKNGVEMEIYNGSEIYFSQSKTQHFKGYVKWSDKELCHLVHCYWEKQDVALHFCDGYEMKYTYDNSCVKRLDSECFDIVVIGTIHEGEINNDAP